MMGSKFWEIDIFKNIASDAASYYELEVSESKTFALSEIELANKSTVDVYLALQKYNIKGVDLLQCNLRKIISG